MNDTPPQHHQSSPLTSRILPHETLGSQGTCPGYQAWLLNSVLEQTGPRHLSGFQLLVSIKWKEPTRFYKGFPGSKFCDALVSALCGDGPLEVTWRLGEQRPWNSTFHSLERCLGCFLLSKYHWYTAVKSKGHAKGDILGAQVGRAVGHCWKE